MGGGEGGWGDGVGVVCRQRQRTSRSVSVSRSLSVSLTSLLRRWKQGLVSFPPTRVTPAANGMWKIRCGGGGKGVTLI